MANANATVNLTGDVRKSNYSENGNSRFFSAYLSFRTKRHQVDENGNPTRFMATEIIKIKAFGKTAEIMGQYVSDGDNISLVGNLDREEDYTDKNGVSQRGQFAVTIDDYSTNKRGANSSSDDAEPDFTPITARNNRPARQYAAPAQQEPAPAPARRVSPFARRPQ